MADPTFETYGPKTDSEAFRMPTITGAIGRFDRISGARTRQHSLGAVL